MRTPERLLIAAAYLLLLHGPLFAQSLPAPSRSAGLVPQPGQECRDETKEARVDDETHARMKAWEILGQDGYSKDNYREKVTREMRAAGELSDIQRLEVTGVLTNEDGKTPAFDGLDEQLNPHPQKIFDRNLHASHLAEVFSRMNKSRLPAKLRAVYYSRDLVKAAKADLAEAHAEMNGDLTARGRDRLRQVQGKHINELVAHSWGTDVVYNGILEGVIMPPKRIILVGIPNGYVTKWKELADRLPVEVEIYSSANDLVRKANEDYWRVRTGTRHFNDPPVFGQEVWRRKVASYCERPESNCKNSDRGISLQVHMNVPNQGFLNHARQEYYDYLASRGRLSESPEELRDAELIGVDGRMNAKFEEAMAQARKILRDNPIGTVTERICTPGPSEGSPRVAPMPQVPVAPPPATAPMPLPPPYKPYDELYLLARSACQNPDGLTIDEMRSHLRGFPDNQRYLFIENWSIPPGCLKDLFFRLMEMNATVSQGQTISFPWLVNEAKRLNGVHAPLPSPDPDQPRKSPPPGYDHCIDPGGSCLR